MSETQLLYSKTGVHRDIPIFLNYVPKHRLWVLVKTALLGFILHGNVILVGGVSPFFCNWNSNYIVSLV